MTSSSASLIILSGRITQNHFFVIHILNSSLIKQDQVFILEENNLNQELSLVWNAQRSFFLKKTPGEASRVNIQLKKCCFSFITAMVNIIPHLLNSGQRKLRETWGGPIRNRLYILGEPIRNSLLILGRSILNHLCILGGLIWKPIRNRNLSKRVWIGRGFLGLAGLLLGISLGLAQRKSLGAALPALRKPCPSLHFYLYKNQVRPGKTQQNLYQPSFSTVQYSTERRQV